MKKGIAVELWDKERGNRMENFARTVLIFSSSYSTRGRERIQCVYAPLLLSRIDVNGIVVLGDPWHKADSTPTPFTPAPR